MTTSKSQITNMQHNDIKMTRDSFDNEDGDVLRLMRVSARPKSTKERQRNVCWDTHLQTGTNLRKLGHQTFPDNNGQHVTVHSKHM